MKTLLVLAGPTAVGKTETALRLAERLHCPIISADDDSVKNTRLRITKAAGVVLKPSGNHPEESAEIAFSFGDIPVYVTVRQ